MKKTLFSILTLVFLLNYCLSQDSRIWGRYFGGSGQEQSLESGTIARDLSGNIYITGYTTSSSGLALNGHQNNYGGIVDGYLAKFDANGNLLWATYYGRSERDWVNAVAVDATGYVYIAGTTESSNSGSAIATNGTSFQGGRDAFVAKFNSSGTRIWGTYFGSTGYDYGNAIGVDNNGNVFLAGETSSATNISTGGAHQPSIGGGTDAYLVKINGSNGSVIWATYYGGFGNDLGQNLSVDLVNNVYLAGYGQSADQIAWQGHQNTAGGGNDAFLVKFNEAGARQWATYYGGSGEDRGETSVSTDASGNVYLSGYTTSTSGIEFNGFDNSYAGGFDGFLVKFDAAGIRQWGTYYGGSGLEYPFALGIDPAGNVYMTGTTQSSSDIASGGFQNSYTGSGETFLVKFDATGSMQCGTYYGGSSDDRGLGIVIDGSGNVYMTGYTSSSSNINSSGFSGGPNGGSGYDAFLVKLTSCGTATPIQWIDFHAMVNPDNSVSLSWTVSGTSANQEFVVERKSSETDWTKSATVKAGKNNDAAENFTFTDYSATSGKNFYRIKGLDADGNISFSNILEVEVYGLENHFGILNIYPNPARESINMTVNIPETAPDFTLRLSDPAGRTMKEWKYDVNVFPHTLKIDLNNLEQGAYFLQLKCKGISQTVKFIAIGNRN